jgi:hypothetical protein
VYPNKGCRGRSIDSTAVEVTTGTGDDAANEQTDDNSGGFHNRRTEALAYDDGDKDGETETNKFSAAPGKSMGSVNGRAQLEDSSCRERFAVSAATGPVLETRLDELYADEHDSGSSDEWWEDLLEIFGCCEGHQDFEKRADCACADDSTITVRAR